MGFKAELDKVDKAGTSGLPLLSLSSDDFTLFCVGVCSLRQMSKFYFQGDESWKGEMSRMTLKPVYNTSTLVPLSSVFSKVVTQMVFRMDTAGLVSYYLTPPASTDTAPGHSKCTTTLENDSGDIFKQITHTPGSTHTVQGILPVQYSSLFELRGLLPVQYVLYSMTYHGIEGSDKRQQKLFCAGTPTLVSTNVDPGNKMGSLVFQTW